MTMHAIERGRDRYGVDLAMEDIEGMKWAVAGGGSWALPLGESAGDVLWAVRHASRGFPARWFFAVIAPDGNIVTLMDPRVMHHHFGPIRDHERRSGLRHAPISRPREGARR